MSATESETITVNLSEVARRTGYSLSHLSRIISQETTPSVHCLDAIAAALCMSLGETWTAIKEQKFECTKTDPRGGRESQPSRVSNPGQRHTGA